MKKRYIVEVMLNVPEGDLHPLDQDEGPSTGEYFVMAENEDAALDWFHSTYPIKSLDDYQVTARPNTSKLVDFDLLKLRDEIHCALCQEEFMDGQRVFNIVDGTWNGDGPNFESSRDQAFVHAACVESD